MPPNCPLRSIADDLVNTYYLTLNREQTRRRQRADETDRKAAEAKSKSVELVEKPAETEVAEKLHVVEVDEQVAKVAVVQ